MSMEFVRNNLEIIVSFIIAVVSACFNVYQYFENKRLKQYGTEKDLKRRRASLEKLRNRHQSNSWLLTRLGEKEEEKHEFICREKELLAEIEYLEKILTKSTPRLAFTILILVIATHFIANTFGIYDAQITAGNVWIDNVLHILIGLAVALLWESLTKGKYPIFSTLVFVLALAIGWEVCELIFYSIAPEQALDLKIYSPSIQEAAIDIASNLLGAVPLTFWRLIHDNKSPNILP